MDTPPLTPAALEAARQWFRSQARAYPWTLTQDPYAIWISEVMLQQTVVSAAVAPYERWLARWPDVASLAAAALDDVLRAWEGLGYASRAKNLHRTAQVLVAQGLNTLPRSDEELRQLPGVGEYTAAAILSFAFHQPALTLDANLKRVFLRLESVQEWSPSVERRWRDRWRELVDGPVSRDSNQAIMQLGQLVCRPKAPLCEACPLASVCLARERGTAAQIPLPVARAVIEKSTRVVAWHREERTHWWLARPEKGRFSNLWLLPPLDDPTSVPGAQTLQTRLHTYTKYRDRVLPVVAPWSGGGSPPLPVGWVGRWVTADEARGLGMVSVYRKILNEALD